MGLSDCVHLLRVRIYNTWTASSCPCTASGPNFLNNLMSQAASRITLRLLSVIYSDRRRPGAQLIRTTSIFQRDLDSMPYPLSRGSASPQQTVFIANVFVVFVCLALLGVDVWLALRAREHEIRQATISNTNLAQAVSQQMDSMFSEVGNILSNIANEFERNDVDAGLVERLQPVLVSHATLTAHIHDIFVYDAQGAWLVSSQAAVPVAANNSDRDYFIHHRRSPSATTLIGKPIVSRSTGLWVIPVSRRFNDWEGNFAGVVLATIKVDYIKQLISKFTIGEQGALGLMLKDGTILVRRPFVVADLGKSSVGSSLYTLMTKQHSGHGQTTSPFDGVERLVSYEHLKDHPVIVAVAVSKNEMLREWRATTLFQTGWILALCIFIGLSGAYVVSSVRERLAVELSLGRTRDELTDANAQLQQLARQDALTLLANRRCFDEMLIKEFAEARRSQLPLALIMIDVDHFKLYNDAYGHPEGDRCLQQVALAIRSAARRPRDFVARYGGEEMAMVLPDTDAAGAAVVAEAAREAVAALQRPHTTSAIGYVSISAGVSVYVPGLHTTNAQDLLRSADTALYRAKEAGRNTVLIAEERGEYLSLQ
jgi:diguanylate cyclase (GGDEF)-like protein